MDQRPHVVIVMARCCQAKQGFGMRFEEQSQDQWIANWAFAMREATAKREGYDQGTIDGAFGFDATYPGCPYCQAVGIFQCSCGKVACWDGNHGQVTCPWCGITDTISGDITSLWAGGDR